MRLAHGLHLASCTNVHRSETWDTTFAALRAHTLAVRDRVCLPAEPYAIGLRLSDRASRELAEPPQLDAFKAWLADERCYVFTIDGFQSGNFHGAHEKEEGYRPDWTESVRLDYTCRLLDLLGDLLPEGVDGSVSTLPGSFKQFVAVGDMEPVVQRIYTNLIHCAVHAAEVGGRTGRNLRLALEPAPLGLFENTAETIRFLRPLVDGFPQQFGVCFDACHFAVEFEEPAAALAALTQAGIPVVKLRLSAALKTHDQPDARKRLRSFADDGYLHQVGVRGATPPVIYRDLPDALDAPTGPGDEWRVHFHVPLHCAGDETFGTTADELAGVFDWLADDPARCPHLEMESGRWEVLPPGLKTPDVADQLVREYD